MSKNYQLVIVESPTKARKLSQFLGEGYLVEASVGHLRDLPKNKLSVSLDGHFTPQYQVNAQKKDLVSKLRKLASKADKIILAMEHIS